MFKHLNPCFLFKNPGILYHLAHIPAGPRSAPVQAQLPLWMISSLYSRQFPFASQSEAKGSCQLPFFFLMAESYLSMFLSKVTNKKVYQGPYILRRKLEQAYFFMAANNIQIACRYPCDMAGFY